MQEAEERTETEVRSPTEQCLQQEHQRVLVALQRNGLDEAVARERAEELQQLAHRGQGWPQPRQAATAPTEGEPIVGDDEPSTRDGPRSSRYASAAAGGMMMRLADLEAARQQREEDHAWWAQVSDSRCREVEIEAAAILAEAAESQQLEFEAELRATEKFAECRYAKVAEAASVSAEYNFDEATVAPLLMWLTSHSAAWAMGRMATVVVRAARTTSSRPTEGKLQWIRSSLSRPTEGKLQCSENRCYAASGTAALRR